MALLEDDIKFTKELIDQARTNKNTEFQFLHNLAELRTAKQLKKAQKKVVKGFNVTMKKIFADYLQDLDNGTEELEKLIAYKEIKHCRDYYKKEFDIFKDMIKEYKCYVLSGHIMNTLCDIDRPLEDEVDFRTLPISWP